MKSDYNSRIEELEAKLSGLQHDDINIKDLLNKGIDNLLRLDQVYESADIDKKREVISSIFPEKFHFENNSLRTERVNETVMCIYRINSNLDQKKEDKTSLILFCPLKSGRKMIFVAVKRFISISYKVPIANVTELGTL